MNDNNVFTDAYFVFPISASLGLLGHFSHQLRYGSSLGAHHQMSVSHTMEMEGYSQVCHGIVGHHIMENKPHGEK